MQANETYAALSCPAGAFTDCYLQAFLLRCAHKFSSDRFIFAGNGCFICETPCHYRFSYDRLAIGHFILNWNKKQTEEQL
jgi:hypothetical protein